MARLRSANNIPVIQFDPNVAPRQRLYGVYDGHAFHVTAKRATAIQKVYARSECSIWEAVNGAWVLRGLKDGWRDPGQHCDECSGVLGMGSPSRRYYSNGAEGGWAFTRTNGRIDDPLVLRFMCFTCFQWHKP